MKNRLLLSGLASTGALETAILTYSKYFSSESAVPFCSDLLCSSALTSKYSTIPFINIPLVSVGLAGYVTIAGISIFSFLRSKCATVKPASKRTSDSGLDTLLLFLTTSMATFSGYLMFILLLVLHSSCTFCITSSAISLAMAAVAWNSSLVQNKTKAFVVASSSVLITLIASGFLYYTTTAVLDTSAANAVISPPPFAADEVSLMEDDAIGNHPPAITTTSSATSIQLAEKMKLRGAKLYGAYWCSHCYNQKQVFGKDAFSMLEYIECDAAGYNSKVDFCKTRKLVGYPTWEIGGELFPGEKSLSELERILFLTV